MSTETMDTALGYLPAERKTSGPHGILNSIRAFFTAIGEGIEAAHRYERLTHQGTPPQKAVEIVFRDHFANRR